jgi:hypothetical protein
MGPLMGPSFAITTALRALARKAAAFQVDLGCTPPAFLHIIGGIEAQLRRNVVRALGNDYTSVMARNRVDASRCTESMRK